MRRDDRARNEQAQADAVPGIVALGGPRASGSKMKGIDPGGIGTPRL